MGRFSTPGVATLPSPTVRLSVGVTGHRDTNAAFLLNRARIADVLASLFEALDAASAEHCGRLPAGLLRPARLQTLLALGADSLAVEVAQARGWEVVAPLPFGLALNVAINARPSSAQEARSLLDGGTCGAPEVAARARALRDLASRVQLFELADQDATIAGLLDEHLAAPGGSRAYTAAISERAAAAARVMIEQSDLVIGIWDGVSHAGVGGTEHTIAAALDRGSPVIWIDARAPDDWRLLHAPESLAALASGADPATQASRAAALYALVGEALCPAAPAAPHGTDGAGARARHTSRVDPLRQERWRARSNPLFHAYRRIESLFGGVDAGPRRLPLRQTYASPDAVDAADGRETLAIARALPNADQAFAERIGTAVLRRFAFTDGVASYLSDAYRGGMVTNFLLSAIAILAGIAYLPFAADAHKWAFAVAEFALLASILLIIAVGRRHRWHRRWFETRRAAEYFRHAPILLLLGVARAPGRWPRGVDASWPEWYARHALRELGLPRVAVTPEYLRFALDRLLGGHVSRQRDYHLGKARRLTATHRNLDRLCEALFKLAVVAVAAYLVLKAGGALGLLPAELAQRGSKTFTFLGVMFPTLGGALAGIRYFGDFERFAAISKVTAAKLDVIGRRIRVLLGAPDRELNFGRVADLAHAVDDVVVTEIENWQAVFGGKQISVPV